MLFRLVAAVCGLVAFAFGVSSGLPAMADVTAEKSDDKVTIKIDGKLFAEYLTNSGGKPIVWPIIGPAGDAEMTRAYPLKRVAGEETDHIHQRSLWFTHGDVNGVDFWMEGARAGKQVHKEFVRLEGGKQATIVTRNDWVGPDGKKMLEDERRLVFFPMGDNRVIDYDIVLKATEGAVTFGDTKEGSFGIRVPTTLRVETKKGGRIQNSGGQRDDATTLGKGPFTWGKRAAWVDYSGPVVSKADNGEHVVGIAILNHPKSFRFPTHWHVRTYGLFAANPFGIHDFEKKERGTGNHTLQQGESMSLRYRVIFHRGDAEQARIAEAFNAYAGRDEQAAAK